MTRADASYLMDGSLIYDRHASARLAVLHTTGPVVLLATGQRAVVLEHCRANRIPFAGLHTYKPGTDPQEAIRNLIHNWKVTTIVTLPDAPFADIATTYDLRFLNFNTISTQGDITWNMT